MKTGPFDTYIYIVVCLPTKYFFGGKCNVFFLLLKLNLEYYVMAELMDYGKESTCLKIDMIQLVSALRPQLLNNLVFSGRNF